MTATVDAVHNSLDMVAEKQELTKRIFTTQDVMFEKADVEIESDRRDSETSTAADTNVEPKTIQIPVPNLVWNYTAPILASAAGLAEKAKWKDVKVMSRNAKRQIEGGITYLWEKNPALCLALFTFVAIAVVGTIFAVAFFSMAMLTFFFIASSIGCFFGFALFTLLFALSLPVLATLLVIEPVVFFVLFILGCSVAGCLGTFALCKWVYERRFKTRIE
eukprot:GILK01002769.1.p1 GENE.GILK01002769.1~~GILK01002769.1.p1  ORF type:complete len:219 (+),score=47.61 GILK01002769.1:41-697(+)